MAPVSFSKRMRITSPNTIISASSYLCAEREQSCLLYPLRRAPGETGWAKNEKASEQWTATYITAVGKHSCILVISVHIQLLEYSIHTFLGVTSKLTHYLRL